MRAARSAPESDDVPKNGFVPKNKNARQIAASADTSSPLMTLADLRILSSVILDYFLSTAGPPHAFTALRPC